MTVRVNLDADNDLYELGDDIDGVFIPFANVPGAQVRGRIETVQQAQEATSTAAPAPATEPAPAGQPTGDLTTLSDAELEAELERRRSGGGA